MKEFCEIKKVKRRIDAIKRRKGRLRWRAARMAVILGGFLYEGKKELDEEDKKIIAQIKKWIEEVNKVYCAGGLEDRDFETNAETLAITMAINIIEGNFQATEKEANGFLKTAFDLFLKIANGEKEKYFLGKLINTHREGYCMIKRLSGEFEL